MKKVFFEPYSNWTLLGYSVIILIFITFQAFILNNSNGEIAMTALLYLGRVTGGAFAFLFSIGLYLVGKSEKISQKGMPLFNSELLLFCLMFAMSIMLPFVVYSSNLQGIQLKVGIIVSFSSSFFCYALIPFAYESIQKRYEPRQVLRFLRDKALKNLEKTEDYTETWQDVLDIDKICRELYETDVDMFAAGIRYLAAILIKGIESYNKRNKIILNKKSISVEEWIRLISTRIKWIGEKVVEDRLAFERVIIEVIVHLSRVPQVIYNICYYLCKYAKTKKQEESLRIGLYYFLPWCKESGFYEKCKDLEHS